MYDRIEKHWKATLSILVVVGLFAGLYQDLISPVYKWVSSEEVPVKSKTILHILPEEISINVSAMKDSGFPDFYRAELKVQAREYPILLSNKVKLVKQEFNSEYFSEDITHYDENFKVLKVESDKVSFEHVGEIAKIKLLIKPMFVFPDTRCIVYQRCKNEIVGKVELEVYYTYGGSEQSSTVEVPIRFI